MNVVVSDPDPQKCKAKMERATEQLIRYLDSNQILPSPSNTQLLLIPRGRKKSEEEEESGDEESEEEETVRIGKRKADTDARNNQFIKFLREREE